LAAVDGRIRFGAGAELAYIAGRSAPLSQEFLAVNFAPLVILLLLWLRAEPKRTSQDTTES
jgi:hypothetical protein